MFRVLRPFTSVRSCHDPLTVFRVGAVCFGRWFVSREFQERGGEEISGNAEFWGGLLGVWELQRVAGFIASRRRGDLRIGEESRGVK